LGEELLIRREVRLVERDAGRGLVRLRVRRVHVLRPVVELQRALDLLPRAPALRARSARAGSCGRWWGPFVVLLLGWSPYGPASLHRRCPAVEGVGEGREERRSKVVRARAAQAPRPPAARLGALLEPL